MAPTVMEKDGKTFRAGEEIPEGARPAIVFIHFHTGILEIQRKRNQRQTVLLDLAKHPVDLLMVHQKLSDTHRICPEQAVLFIRGNVHSFHEQLAVCNVTPSILQIDMTQPNRLHFIALQCNSSLIAFQNEILMPCLPVVTNFFGSLCLHCTHFLSVFRVKIV